MENNRITREEFITICREKGFPMSQATIDRKLKNADFVAVSGAKKEMTATSKIPTWTFDRDAVEKIQTLSKPEKPVKESKALVKSEVNAVQPIAQKTQSQPKENDFASMFLLPHKIYLTLDEAKLLTGFPKTELHKISELKFGRRVIKKSELEKL